MRPVTVTAFLLLAAVATAQPAQIASIEQKLEAKVGPERVPVLLELAETLDTIDLERAFAAAREARKLAADPVQQLEADVLLAGLHRQRTDYAEALRLARDGLAAATKLGNERLRGRFSYVIARTQWSLADYPASVASFHEAIRLGGRTDDGALLVDAHIGISTIFNEFKQPQEAEFHIQQARKYAEQLGDPERLGDFYRVYGNYLGQGKGSPEARVAHERSREFHALAGNMRGVADALQNIGFIDEVQGDYNTARAKFTEAIAIYEQIGLKRHLTNAHRQLGRVLGRMGHTAEALEHMDTSLRLAREVGAQVAIANLYRDRAIVHEASGNLKAALDDQRELQTYNERIFGERAQQRIAVLTARFESERRQHEIDLLKRDQELKDAELARVRWQGYGLFGALILGGVAVAAFVSRQRLKLVAERRVLAETRRAKEAAERADAFKTKLLGITSHDLKAPVAALITGADALQVDAADPAAVRAMAQLMGQEGRRMMTLIRDLLDLAALETGRIELRRAPLEVAAIARESAEVLEPRARAKGQSFSCLIETSAESACVDGDHARLRQVIDNLLDNAIKFTPAGRAVRVAVSHASGNVRVAVQDEGPGLKPEDFARLFQPFQKLSARPTGAETSTGLGLSIVREIVALHGGQMIVDTVPGEGATFGFELPLVGAS